MSGDPEDFDLLAGIYVLGALEADEARAVEDLAARDPGVAHAVEAWQNRLAPLAAAVPPSPVPPDLWASIEATIGFAPEPTAAPAQSATATAAPPALALLRRAWHSLPVWRTATAALALAAALAGITLVTRPEPTRLVTTLAPAGSPAPVFVAQVETDGTLLIRPLSAVQVAGGKDLELWALPEGAQKPISLGVLPPIGRSVAAQKLPPAPVQLLVSLEPAGGSPTGAPTGPVLFGGTLKRF